MITLQCFYVSVVCVYVCVSHIGDEKCYNIACRVWTLYLLHIIKLYQSMPCEVFHQWLHVHCICSAKLTFCALNYRIIDWACPRHLYAAEHYPRAETVREYFIMVLYFVCVCKFMHVCLDVGIFAWSKICWMNFFFNHKFALISPRRDPSDLRDL